MKYLSLIFVPCLVLFSCSPSPQKWKAAPAPLMSKWAGDVSPEKVWPEYPRPQMQRASWLNLNGLWQFAIRRGTEVPRSWEEEILVPFAVEAALSGIGHSPGPDSTLWYRRSFRLPEDWKGNRILLHFEASDWKTTVWVNQREAGSHQGGYDPFSFDITNLLEDNAEQEIVVSVWDPTDEGTQPRGKQVLNPGGIYYTPVSGIWQTVWLEPLSKEAAIKELFIETKPFEERLSLRLEADLLATDEWELEVQILEGEKLISTTKHTEFAGKRISIELPDPHLWSPEDPFLYGLKLSLKKGGKVFDSVESYFGMRETKLQQDQNGITRIQFNGEFVFQNGLLDQGFWPAGIYTAPTDEALRYDIEVAKKLGFNLLRKHVKVEPRRWYYWADKLGILVWQDMPSGDKSISPHEPDMVRSPEATRQYEAELTAMIRHLYNHPSIIVWVPFNEGWGQFETARITDYTWSLDSTRLVNAASGWTDRGTGDILDFHAYPAPVPVPPEERRAAVLGEFGGLGLPVEGHLWEQKNWGYAVMNSPEALLERYESFYNQVWALKEDPGLSGVVYTQLTDVETEVNGLLTYDRAVIKADADVFFSINQKNYVPAPAILAPSPVFYLLTKVELKQQDGLEIRYTIDGSEPDSQSYLYQNALTLTTDIQIRARAIASGGKMSRVVSRSFQWRDDPSPVYIHRYSDRYHAGGDYALIDGKKGSESYTDGKWQGISGENLEVVVDLGPGRRINFVQVGFLETTGAWIFLPESLEVLVSQDSVEFESVGRLAFGQPSEDRDPSIIRPEIKFPSQEARYVRILAKSIGPCPEWHNGAGGDSWIFVDEIEIK